jgi:hypothetical protein
MQETRTQAESIKVAIIEDERDIRDGLGMLTITPKASSALANTARWKKP